MTRDNIVEEISKVSCGGSTEWTLVSPPKEDSVPATPFSSVTNHFWGHSLSLLALFIMNALWRRARSGKTVPEVVTEGMELQRCTGNLCIVNNLGHVFLNPRLVNHKFPVAEAIDFYIQGLHLQVIL